MLLRGLLEETTCSEPVNKRSATQPHKGEQACHDLRHEFLVEPFGSGQHDFAYGENGAPQKYSGDDEHGTLVQHNIAEM